VIDQGVQRKRWVKPLVTLGVLLAVVVLLRLTWLQPARVAATVDRVDVGRDFRPISR
jgi:hypothetical protein